MPKTLLSKTEYTPINIGGRVVTPTVGSERNSYATINAGNTSPKHIDTAIRIIRDYQKLSKLSS